MTGEPTTSERSQALLEKYKPLLVIFPQVAQGKKVLHRPGASLPVRGTWGDYHPCSAEYLLDRLTQRDEPLKRSVDIKGFIRHKVFRQKWRPLPPTGINALKAKAKKAGPQATAAWELDVSDLPSQDESLAWKQYGRMLKDGSPPFSATVYGREVNTSEGRALQYWYLYIYNDFWNNHECDWEMATVVLGQDETPEIVAYSQHIGGSHRKWAAVKKEKAGVRPILYVARGSHAGYFDYSPDGHPPVNLNTGAAHPVLKGRFAFLNFLVSPILKAIYSADAAPSWLPEPLAPKRGLRDYPPADRELDKSRVKSERYYGVRLDPKLEPLPADQPPSGADGDLWWLNLKCPWGSRHLSVPGFTGVRGPWTSTSDTDIRWGKPVKWAQHTPADGM